MSFSLAHFPREVLAEIVSHLEAHIVTYQLPRCGDSTLTHKFKTGGVTGLRFTSGMVLPAMLKFFASTALDSVVIKDLKANHSTLRTLIHALPSTLRSFEVEFEQVTELCLLEDELYECPSSDDYPLSLHSKAVWIVRDTFPHLERLLFTDHTISDVSQDVTIAAEFLNGLPSSLRELSLPFLRPDAIDYYQLLPPNLRRLNDMMLIPPTAKAIQHVQHLEELKLALRAFTHNTNPIPSHWEPGLVPNLLWPPSLTKLDIVLSDDLLRLIDTLPPSVRSLKLMPEFTYSPQALAQNLVFRFLALLPPSARELQIMFPITSNTNAQHSEAPATILLPSVKALLVGRHCRSCLAPLLGMMPNVEDLDVGDHIDLEELSQINGTVLKRLATGFTRKCFEPPSRSLASMFPKVETLQVSLEDKDAPIDFNFGALPPSLTRLLLNFPVTTAHLHLLPPSVTDCVLEDEVRVVPGVYFDWLTSEGIKSTATTSRRRWRWREQAIVGVGGVVPTLELPGDQETVFGTRFDSELQALTLSHRPIGTASFFYDFDGITMSQSLTSLVIPGTRISECAEISARYPHLTKLKVCSTGGKPKEFDGNLSVLTSVLDLELETPYLIIVSWPPNLTRLKSKDVFHDKPYRKPIPPTVTDLDCAYISSKRITELKSLKSLVISDRGDPAWNSERTELPTSLTNLSIPAAELERWALDSLKRKIFGRLPSLTALSMKGILTTELLERLHVAASPTVKIGAEDLANSISDLKALAVRVRASVGGLALYPGESLEDFASRLLARAYPHIVPRDHIITTLSLNLDAWSAFLPYLAPTTELKLSLMGIGSRVVTSWANGRPSPGSPPLVLPPNLQRLTFVAARELGARGLINALPPTLTHLDIANWKIEFTDVVWPPNMTYLRSDHCRLF